MWFPPSSSQFPHVQGTVAEITLKKEARPAEHPCFLRGPPFVQWKTEAQTGNFWVSYTSL